MGKAVLDRLEERVKDAAAQLQTAKKERERLQAEVKLMQDESRRARKVLRQYDELLKERKKVQEKLEGLLEKLDQLKIS